MTLKVRATNRGFPFVEVLDYYRKPCRLQLSSLADKECVWLGENHLSREQIAELLPFLQAFVEKGYLFFEDFRTPLTAPPPA